MRRIRQHKVQRLLRHSIRRDAMELKLFYALIVAFLLIAGFFIFALLSATSPKQADYDQILAITSAYGGAGFVNGNEVDSVALENFDSSYESIKAQNGIKNDFYVYFEDQNGDVVPLDGKTCFGSDQAAQVDSRCK